jgi:sugar phosphate isomerase/epimerase
LRILKVREEKRMRIIRMVLGVAGLAAMVAGCSGTSSGTASGDSFPGTPGLQLYSLRTLFAEKGVQAGLDQSREFGFKTVELGGTYKLKTEEFLPLLKERGLRPVSGHFAWDRWKNDPDGVAAEAKALGLECAGCAWANHKDPFDEAQAREVIDVFTKAGMATKKVGIRFFYHLHGFEFVRHGDETLADLLIRGTDPELVSFQMDVLWVFFPGQDPASWLLRYPGRWVSMHLKDLRKGVERGPLTGKTDVRNDVALGTGQVNWRAVLAAAKKSGVKYYFIEDESPDVLTQIPVTLQFLRDVRF